MNNQWPTFFQTLFSIAAQRPQTAVILTLPSEQDANRRLTGELKQFIPTVLETVARLCENSPRSSVRWDQRASVHLKLLRMGN